MLTATTLAKKVIVQVTLKPTAPQSAASPSRNGLRIEYAVIRTKTKANDSSVALSSLGSICAVAFIRRDSGLLRSVEAKFEARFQFLLRIGAKRDHRFGRDDPVQVPHLVTDNVR